VCSSDLEKFSQVFGLEARIVVIFYRKTWGNKGFTRVEEIAIKNRAYRGDDHYNFMLLVNLEDTNPEIPWIPITNIYFSLKNYAIEALAASIENLVIQNGGIVHEETSFDLAIRIERKREAEQKRKEFLESENGVITANNEFRILCKSIRETVESLTKISQLYKGNIKEDNSHLSIHCCELNLYCMWVKRAINTLNGSFLKIAISDNLFIMTSQRAKELYERFYLFDRNLAEQTEWYELTNKSHIYTSQQLADLSVKMFIKAIDSETTKRENPKLERKIYQR
jgi:hypothetical protein